MKTAFLAFAFCLAMLSCKKEGAETFCFDGLVQWHGDPAADGLGWVLVNDDSTALFRPFVPRNLPDDLKTDNLKVEVCLYETRDKFYCECPQPLNKYHITQIRRR